MGENRNQCDHLLLANAIIENPKMGKEIISTILQQCIVCPPCENTKKKSKPKTKRKMTGYNCFLKECAKTKSFQDCLKGKGWQKLSDSEKEKYNEMAKEGCKI